LKQISGLHLKIKLKNFEENLKSYLRSNKSTPKRYLELKHLLISETKNM
jgi:hypothetical protein